MQETALELALASAFEGIPFSIPTNLVQREHTVNAARIVRLFWNDDPLGHAVHDGVI